MNRIPGSTKFTFTLVVILAFLILPSLAMAQTSGAQDAETGSRVGTYDSRAIAIAHFRSETFAKKMKDLHAEAEKARDDGDEKKIEQMETYGKALQDKVHRQGFGTESVDDILETILDRFPQIAKQAGVQIIVSKWDIAYLQPGIDLIDVTDLMIKPFEPDEATLKIIESLRETDPIPRDELKRHSD